MRTMLAGEAPDFTALGDLDASNAAFLAPWRERLLDDVVAELGAARRDWLSWLGGLPVEEFFRQRSYGGDDWSFHTVPLQVQWEHDAEHAAQIAAWREVAGLCGGGGTRAILAAALAAARAELLAAAALVPAAERDSQLVCGSWTLRDVLGHIADWEWFGVEGLRLMAAGRPPDVEEVGDIDGWNQAHVEARRGQTWDEVWHDLHMARQALLEAWAGIGETELARSFPFPWGPQGTPYQWASVYLAHDREHAAELRSGAG